MTRIRMENILFMEILQLENGNSLLKQLFENAKSFINYCYFLIISCYQSILMDVRLISTRPTTYFQLIEMVGSKGIYQNIVFIIFCVQWFVTGLILLGPGFIFMTQDPTCSNPNLTVDQCQTQVCSFDASTWHTYYPNQPDSLVFSFGKIYVCDQEYIVTIVSSLTYIGCLVGYLFFSFYADNFGRKFTVLFSWTVTVAGLILLYFSWNIWIVGVALFFVGAGSDSAVNFAFFFFDEQVEDRLRQYFSVAVQQFFCIGGMSMAGLFYLMPHWRQIVLYTMLIPAIVCEVLMLLLQQTPKFAMKKSNKHCLDALGNIAKLNGYAVNPVTMEDIESVAQQEVDEGEFKKKMTAFDIFRYKSLRIKSIACCVVSFCIYLLYYGPIFIVNEIGFDIYITQVLLSAAEFITYFITFFMITKIPRKLFGQVAFSVCFVMTFILIFIKKPEVCERCKQVIVQLVLVCVARFFLAMYFAIFLIFTAEMYPESVRGLGIGVSSAIGTIASSSISYIVSWCKDNNINSMIIFTSIAVIAFVMVIPLKETLGLKLEEEIQEILAKKSAYKSIKKNSLIKTSQETEKVQNRVVKTETD